LEVFFDSGNHEELLVLLGSLGKGVKRTGRETRWNEEVACALGRALGENRRFDFEKTLGVHHIAHGLHNAVAQAQVAAHLLAAQIEVAVG
jgi:hypothetical protein